MKERQAKAFLHTSRRTGGQGKEIIVSTETLREVPDGTAVTFRSVSPFRFRWHFAYTDAEQRVAIYGFFVALAGLAIDGSFDLGTVIPVLSLQTEIVVVLKSIAWLLKVVGLGLVLWKGILGAKP